MARVTVEDCLKNVKNRFELVIVAARRARQLMRGKDPKVDWDNDKPTVVALREIAEGYVDTDTQDAFKEETTEKTIPHFNESEAHPSNTDQQAVSFSTADQPSQSSSEE